MQTSYDSKLTTATYDAVKAFQINSLNDSTSDSATSKIRDIEASVETFYNSVSENFQISEGDKDSIKNYIPALVYTMYDGFYIYSPFYNTVNPTQDASFELNDNSKYQDGEKLYGLKPYIYYSCRYKKGADTDCVITYSLDNYITIQGMVKGEAWDIAGYLLDNVNIIGENITYNNINISKESALKENVLNKEDLPYIQKNGTKYYLESDGNTYNVFSIISGEKKYINSNLKETYKNEINKQNDSAQQYYKLAKEFTEKVRNELRDLTFGDAYSEDGTQKMSQKYPDLAGFSGNTPIFAQESGKAIEESDSNFNEHRVAVIRYAIQKNLSVAITNFNDYSSSTNDFQMPNLSETDWYSIINNISMISFLQGMPIGGKMYNGYSIVVNNKNKEVVSEDSIYITTNDNNYHKINSTHLRDFISYKRGVYNIDFERRSYIDPDTLQTKYYFPQKDLGCYDCIINSSGVGEEDSDILKYVKKLALSGSENEKKIAKLYYTALGRERYSMNRTSYEIYANNYIEGTGNWKYITIIK